MAPHGPIEMVVTWMYGETGTDCSREPTLGRANPSHRRQPSCDFALCRVPQMAK